MTQQPKVGDGYTYTSTRGSEVFRVTQVDLVTGSVQLTAECSHERAVEILKLDDGKTDFVWKENEKCWAVNVAWGAWKKVRPVADESAMTKLTRLTEAFGGYDFEAISQTHNNEVSSMKDGLPSVKDMVNSAWKLSSNSFLTSLCEIPLGWTFES